MTANIFNESAPQGGRNAVDHKLRRQELLKNFLSLVQPGAGNSRLPPTAQKYELHSIKTRLNILLVQGFSLMNQ